MITHRDIFPQNQFSFDKMWDLWVKTENKRLEDGHYFILLGVMSGEEIKSLTARQISRLDQIGLIFNKDGCKLLYFILHRKEVSVSSFESHLLLYFILHRKEVTVSSFESHLLLYFILHRKAVTVSSFESHLLLYFILHTQFPLGCPPELAQSSQSRSYSGKTNQKRKMAIAVKVLH